MRQGYVYLARLYGPRYKVGFSADPASRVEGFKTTDPDAKLLASWPGTRDHEAGFFDWLRRFSDCHGLESLGGEVFRMDHPFPEKELIQIVKDAVVFVND